MGWDKGVDFESAYNKILRNMRKNKYPSVCYDAVLLIQLRNGSRVGEAVDAFTQYLRNKVLECYVRVEKRKDGLMRLAVIPREIIDHVNVCTELLDVPREKLVNRVKYYALSKYGFNTHSLRYAFITYLLRQGVNPAIIGRITGHKNLNHILTYTQQKAGDEILRNLL